MQQPDFELEYFVCYLASNNFVIGSYITPLITDVGEDHKFSNEDHLSYQPPPTGLVLADMYTLRRYV